MNVCNYYSNDDVSEELHYSDQSDESEIEETEETMDVS